MKLYIIRHAIAVEAGTPGFEKDSLRPLTLKGASKMRKIARGLKELDVTFDLILSSPYVRAIETANILAEKLTTDKKIIYSDHLTPMGHAELLVSDINEKYGTAANLALVGHEPYLSKLASVLISGKTDYTLVMKKGGVCCLDVNLLRYGRCAMLEWLLTPKQLISIQ